MILKNCPHCKSVNLVDESCESFFCSRCGEKIKIKNEDKNASKLSFQKPSSGREHTSAGIQDGFEYLINENYTAAHEIFEKELMLDADNMYALVGEAICSPYSRGSFYAKLKSRSDDISDEERNIINKSNGKIFAKLYCEFDDAQRIDYMISYFPSSITIDLLDRQCYQHKNINITSVLISGYVSTLEIFNRFMDFAYTSNNLYSSFDSRYLRPSDLALLISAGLSTNEKIITLKKYDNIDNFTNISEEKVSIKDFFRKYFNGTFSSSDDAIVSDDYRFYGHSYYEDSVTRKSITITPESYLNIIKNYKIKTKYKNVKEYNCFMATYIFGSYDCPELWILRRFRDKKLYIDRSLFPYIELYYKISPKLINLFNKSITMQAIYKSFLIRFIQILKSRNYDDTPYSDFI